MKKILFAATSIAVLFGFTACNDGFLDKRPLDKLTEEAVFNSDALAKSYVNALYAVLPDPFQEGNLSAIADEGFFRYGGSSTRIIGDGRMDPDNIMYMSEGGALHNSRQTILNIWNRAFQYIRDMNYFINYVTEKPTTLTEAGKQNLLGECYFLRAWAYTNLIQRYAGVPIIKKTFNMEDDFGIKRDNFDDCVDFILSDLDEAYKLLPDVSKSEKGRANKDVALALRARVTLIAASPLFNDPDNPAGGVFRGQYSKDKWTRAFNASKAIVDRADVDGAYQLGPTYEDFWENGDSKEIIWGKYFTITNDSGDNSSKKAQLLYSIPYFNGWTALEPTQSIVVDYEMTNGKKFFEEGSGYDPQHPWKNRDPRFYKTIATSGSIYGNTDNTGYHENVLDLAIYYANSKRADFAAGNKYPSFTEKSKHLWNATTATGLELNKWYIPTKPVTESETGNVVYPWFRLAEMYLNYAECAYECNEEDIARSYVNKVRARTDVNMPPISESGTNLWDRIVNERRIELAYENFRFFDVRRLKIAPFTENIPWSGMQTMILDGGKDTLYRIVRVYDESKNNTNYYWPNNEAHDKYIDGNSGRDINYIQTYKWLGKEYKIDFGDCVLNLCSTQRYFPKSSDGVYKHYLIPIARNEITKSGGSIVQNPGY